MHTDGQHNPRQLLDNQLCFALYAASLAMTKIYKPLLEALGLTYPQYLVMLVLWETDGLSVSALGQRLQLDSGTLTPLLKRMQACGWLERQRSSTDERMVHVCLSPAGQALKGQAAHVPECVARQCGISLETLARMRADLHALRLAIKPDPTATQQQA